MKLSMNKLILKFVLKKINNILLKKKKVFQGYDTAGQSGLKLTGCEKDVSKGKCFLWENGEQMWG